MRRYNIEFLEWLRQQAGRDDPVGDLADDFVRGLKATTVRELREQLDSTYGEALLEALREWRDRDAPLPTADDLTAAIRAVQGARLALDEDCDDVAAELRYPRLKRAEWRLERLRGRRRRHFAAERGWQFRCGRTMVEIDAQFDLGVDCEKLRESGAELEFFYDGENLAAVLAHAVDYSPVLRYAARERLNVELLESWEFPGCGVAVVIVAAA